MSTAFFTILRDRSGVSHLPDEHGLPYCATTAEVEERQHMADHAAIWCTACFHVIPRHRLVDMESY